MAHPQQFQFFLSLLKHYPSFFHDGKVAEIGSLKINGSIRVCMLLPSISVALGLFC